jgi:hypothetical protein
VGLRAWRERFSIVDDDENPTGDLIILGNEASNCWARRYAERLGWRRENLPAEGFRLHTVTDGGRTVLLLYGADRAGTLYAAYDFLERLGVRWYGPGEVNEEVPPISDFGFRISDLTSVRPASHVPRPTSRVPRPASHVPRGQERAWT